LLITFLLFLSTHQNIWFIARGTAPPEVQWSSAGTPADGHVVHPQTTGPSLQSLFGDDRHPVVIGGSGGSGTRGVVALLALLGLTAVHDNGAFDAGPLGLAQVFANALELAHSACYSAGTTPGVPKGLKEARKIFAALATRSTIDDDADANGADLEQGETPLNPLGLPPCQASLRRRGLPCFSPNTWRPRERNAVKDVSYKIPFLRTVYSSLRARFADDLGRERWADAFDARGALSSIPRCEEPADPRCPAWGFKAPNSLLGLPLFAALFPNFIFVHVLRDGRDIAFSENTRQAARFFDSLFPRAIVRRGELSDGNAADDGDNRRSGMNARAAARQRGTISGAKAECRRLRRQQARLGKRALWACGEDKISQLSNAMMWDRVNREAWECAGTLGLRNLAVPGRETSRYIVVRIEDLVAAARHDGDSAAKERSKDSLGSPAAGIAAVRAACVAAKMPCSEAAVHAALSVVFGPDPLPLKERQNDGGAREPRAEGLHGYGKWRQRAESEPQGWLDTLQQRMVFSLELFGYVHGTSTKK
jgi:hypothetical protein